jgi:hypothetical protein
VVAGEGGEGTIPAVVVAVRRSAAARRAELMLGADLPTVEVELPEGRTVRRGEVLPVVLRTLRLFSSRG